MRDTATGNIKSLKTTEVVKKARYLDRKGEKVDYRSKYLLVKTVREKEEEISEPVKVGNKEPR